MLDFFNTIWVSNSLDPDQARHFVWPDLGQNCLQRLSADIVGQELNTKQLVDTFWLKLISFDSFSIWLKCWLQQILSQGKPCLSKYVITGIICLEEMCGQTTWGSSLPLLTRTI